MAYTPQAYYPGNYQQPYQMQVQQPQQPVQQMQQPQNNNGLIWVSGEIGAKSYIVAPNNTVMLMDSEGDKFYIKTTDASGMPTLRTFEYKEMTAQNIPQSNQKQMDEQYVTRAEWDEMKAIIDQMKTPPQKTTKKKEVEVDE